MISEATTLDWQLQVSIGMAAAGLQANECSLVINDCMISEAITLDWRLQVLEGMAAAGLQANEYSLVMVLKAANFKCKGRHKVAVQEVPSDTQTACALLTTKGQLQVRGTLQTRICQGLLQSMNITEYEHLEERNIMSCEFFQRCPIKQAPYELKGSFAHIYTLARLRTFTQANACVVHVNAGGDACHCHLEVWPLATQQRGGSAACCL